MVSAVLIISLLMFLAFTMAVVIVFVAKTEKKVPGKNLILFLLGSTFIYTLGYALELSSSSLSYKIFFNHFQYIGLMGIAPFWLMISVQYKISNFKWTIKNAILLFIIPVITLLANFSTLSNGYLYHSYQTIEGYGITLVIYEKGFWYYISIFYQNLLELFTAVNYFKTARKATGYDKRRSSLLFTISAIGFVMTFLCFLTRYTSNVDSGVIVMSVSSILLLIALFKYELFDLLPLAYRKVFEFSDYPIFVVSNNLRIVKVNSAAAGVFSDKLKGDNLKLQDFFTEEPDFFDSLINKDKSLLVRMINGETFYFSAKLISINNDSKAKEYGYLLIFTDETAHVNQLQILENAASVDSLTEVYNRRYFFLHADKIVEKARSTGKSTSIIMLDIDKFKNINDRYGHLAGDYVLKSVSSLIKEKLSAEDILTRYGGEEFVALLPFTDSDTAVLIADQICTEIRKEIFKYGEQCISITVSAGVSTITPDSDMKLEDCISMADKALYRAKNAGRDNVCTHITEQ